MAKLINKMLNFVGLESEEEEFMEARLTVAFIGDGSICAIQKGGSEPLSKVEIESMIDLASKKTKELRKYLG